MKKRILLVEDEKDLVMAVTFRLEDAGYEVITDSDGEEGLGKAKSEKPDLIILDLMLPKMNGYRVCSLLKNDKSSSAIPIIMFTARARFVDKKMSEDAGADAYITKPFKSQELLSKIEELLGAQ